MVGELPESAPICRRCPSQSKEVCCPGMCCPTSQLMHQVSGWFVRQPRRRAAAAFLRLPSMHPDAVPVIPRHQHALLLSPVQANVADSTGRMLAPDELRARWVGERGYRIRRHKRARADRRVERPRLVRSGHVGHGAEMLARATARSRGERRLRAVLPSDTTLRAVGVRADEPQAVGGCFSRVASPVRVRPRTA
jgi:hypothetical protein